MTLLSTPFNHRVVRILAIVIPCVLAVTLGILQYGWISRAAVTEEQRRLESATIDGRRAVESSFDDLRLAVSIMRTVIGLDSGAKAVVAGQALSGWFQQTSFKSLVRGVWLVADTGDSPPKIVHITIDDQTGKVTEADAPIAAVPVALQPAVRLLGDRKAATGSEVDKLRTQLGDEGYILIWPTTGSAPAELAALEVDTATYLTVTLPYYLKRDAPAYHFTVQTARAFPPQIPTLSNGVNTRLERRLYLSVPSFWYASLPRSSLDARSNALALFPEAIASLSLPSRTDHANAVVGAVRIGSQSKDSVGFLSLEYSDGRWSRGVTSWLVSNMAASTLIILLLLSSLVGALLLFTKMRELRTAEMEFVASMSHELRLPITVIGVIADSLSAGIVRDENRMAKYGEQIRRQTTRLSTMVEGILLSAGLQGDGKRPLPALFNPCDAVARVVEELEALAEEHQTTVRVDCLDRKATLRGDASGFSLVLRNLLLNAILHAFPSAPGELRLVRIDVYFDRPSMICLEVSDNGPGIPKKEQKGIFEPFAKTTKSLSEQHQGSGLGLHIARRVVRLSEGSLKLLSPYEDSDGVVHRGCRFVATMKYEETHEGE